MDIKGWQGRLELEFAYNQGHTQPVRAIACAPLKVQRPFYPEGDRVCHSVMLHTAGGVVGGDRLSVQVQVQPAASVLLTTAAASKLYRSNGPTATQQIRLQVGAEACLEWLPQETIVFEGAQFQQTMHVDLAPGGIWLGWEILRFGRSARGEQFLQGQWRASTEVWQEGKPLWIDRQQITGEDLFHGLNGLHGQPVVASFVVLGRSCPATWVLQARSAWDETNAGEIGVTRLQAGLLCRYRGSSTLVARRWLTQVWQQIRVEHLHRSPCIPRVWTS